MKILFVDDDEDIRKQAKMFIEKKENDIELDITRSYEEALDNLIKNDYDAIVSDYHMPEKDGIHLLKYTNENNIELPFLLFTGKGEEKVAMEALNHGADRYIMKEEPISEKYSLLERAITREVERKKLEKDLDMSYKLIQKTLDSLPTALVILNGKGDIIRINEAWSNLSEENYMISDCKVGDNYFENIKNSTENESQKSKEACDGLKNLKDDKEDVFTLEYSFSKKGNNKSYLMRGTKFHLQEKEYLVISHLDITEEN